MCYRFKDGKREVYLGYYQLMSKVVWKRSENKEENQVNVVNF